MKITEAESKSGIEEVRGRLDSVGVRIKRVQSLLGDGQPENVVQLQEILVQARDLRARVAKLEAARS